MAHFEEPPGAQKGKFASKKGTGISGRSCDQKPHSSLSCAFLQRMLPSSKLELPTLEEVERVRSLTSAPRVESSLLWGPISKELSAKAGAMCPTSSVLLLPAIPPKVAADALGEVPSDVLPRADDTVQKLVARLSQSTFLEDSHVLKGGKGPTRVRLNATSYPQPRRFVFV